MVQLIALAAVGTLAWVGYKSYREHAERIAREEEAKKNDAGSALPLEKDPKTGRYRPKD